MQAELKTLHDAALAMGWSYARMARKIAKKPGTRFYNRRNFYTSQLLDRIGKGR